MSALENYRAALHRLMNGRPQIVPKGSAINKDTVALEAGRKRGSIKKSRAENAELIAEIEAAATTQSAHLKPSAAQEVEKQKSLKKAAHGKIANLRKDYEIALSRIVSLVHENYMLKQQLIEQAREQQQQGNVTALGDFRNRHLS
ncbi:hypothetical protein L9Z73_02775 [Pseudomonas sp. TNT11]|uniref:Uncharacterized protein n=1 Tax=Pseudomonas emilianonis TaxID=2915812 RepID=A0ABT0EC81_9PSED|nr:hypothetical protein [Pseudomonas emilianonis]MCK1783321.1 hypothetical protein [Pseudomonas emilianonis]